MDPGSAYYGEFGGGFAPSEVIIISRFRIHDQVAVAMDILQNTRTKPMPMPMPMPMPNAIQFLLFRVGLFLFTKGHDVA